RHRDSQPALHAEADVMDVAQVRADDRPDVVRPAPARPIGRPPVGRVAELDELERASPDRPHLIGVSEAPPLESCHARSLAATSWRSRRSRTARYHDAMTDTTALRASLIA